MYQDILAKLKHHTPIEIGKHHTYAVLLPIVTIDGKDQILYEVRSQLVSQPGEVSFPGGAVEAGESLEAAAVRETCEELRLDPDKIKVLGKLGSLVNARATIHCYVGYLEIQSLEDLDPNEEVDRLFTLSIDQLKGHQPYYHRLQQEISLGSDFPYDRVPHGQSYQFKRDSRKVPFYLDLEENLWGLTANFTDAFMEMMTAEDQGRKDPE